MSKGKKILFTALAIVGFFILIGLFAGGDTQAPTEDFSTAAVNQTAPTPQSVQTVSAVELFGKTETQIRADYAAIAKDFSQGSLTPSKKVKITGFDLNQANVQVDFSVANNKPIYAGYSFSANPLDETTAWAITGFSKPKATPEGNPGIQGRTVTYWQNIDEIKPFKMIQVITEANGKIGKIAFSLEDLNTAKGSSSLYYVP